MAQSIVSKQVGFATRYAVAIQGLISILDGLELLKAEWDANGYATGAQPAGNNITDAILQANGLAYLNASQLNGAIAAVESIRTAAAADRGYLEAIRP